MKRIVLFTASLNILGILSLHVEGSPEDNQSKSSAQTTGAQVMPELFVKYNSPVCDERRGIIKGEQLDSGMSALKARDGSNFDPVSSISLWNITAMINAFWKGTVLQEATFSKYVQRIPLVPQDAVWEWADALKSVNHPGLVKTGNLFAMIAQDRLFETNGFSAAESKKLLGRFNSVPQEAIVKWAEMRTLENWQAAISLINNDSLFDKEIFQDGLFQKLVETVNQKQR